MISGHSDIGWKPEFEFLKKIGNNTISNYDQNPPSLIGTPSKNKRSKPQKKESSDNYLQLSPRGSDHFDPLAPRSIHKQKTTSTTDKPKR